ncbi:MAG: efflux RND transporter permease subunit, partial [Candidatus Zixiibacteriota bacterium]
GTDSGDIYLNITMPEGTGLERTEGAVKNIESIINEKYNSQIKHIFSKIGPTGKATDETEGLADENNADIQLILNDKMNLSRQQIVAGLNRDLNELPDIDIRIILEQTALKATLGTTAAPLVVEIKGDDLTILAGLADSVKFRLESISNLNNIETNFQDGRPEINIQIDRTVASERSLNPEQIGSDLTDLLSGRAAGEMEYQGEYTGITVRRPDVTLSGLQNIFLESSDGSQVRLDEVARLDYNIAPREIIRNNQSRVAEITADISGDEPFDKIIGKVETAISDISLPAEYRMNVTGEEQLRKESFEDLKFALLLAIILVYMVMASQFESLLHPFVILLTIPLAVVGAVFLLLILNMPFNIMSYIGIIMLAGIAVNDSIILVDRINQNRRGGQELNAAIVEAGQTRIRPILITSITTILALLPLTIGIGEGASLRAPMAVAVIGGLISSTALTLIVIPAVYHLIAGKFKIRNEPAE